MTDPTQTPNLRLMQATGNDARHWVTLVGVQRSLRTLYVEQMARAMVRGEWRYSNDLVAFVGSLGAPGCQLVNGQHRIFALIRADELSPGIAVPLIVADNFTDDAPLNFDVGRPRSFADTLDFVEGQQGHRSIASLARLAWHIDHGTWAQRIPSPTRAQEVDFVKANPDLDDALPYAVQLNRGNGGPTAGYGVAVWLIGRGQHVDKLGAFVNQVANGEMVRSVDPAYRLRDAIKRAREGGVSGERFVRAWWIAAVTIEAWNDFVAGGTPQSKYGFRRNQTFPTAR